MNFIETLPIFTQPVAALFIAGMYGFVLTQYRVMSGWWRFFGMVALWSLFTPQDTIIHDTLRMFAWMILVEITWRAFTRAKKV